MEESKGKLTKEVKAEDRRRSRAERAQVLKEYRVSGQTQEEFAAQAGIRIGTLRGWIYRQPPPAGHYPGRLAPVRIVSDARGGTRTPRGTVMVRWPQGMEVEIGVDLDGAGALRLVRELLAPCLR